MMLESLDQATFYDRCYSSKSLLIEIIVVGYLYQASRRGSMMSALSAVEVATLSSEALLSSCQLSMDSNLGGSQTSIS
jgi:hypothetical protein